MNGIDRIAIPFILSILSKNLAIKQAVRARLPAEHPFRLRQIVLLLGLVTSDEEGIEAAMAYLDGIEGRQIGGGQVFLVGHEQRAAGVWRARVGPLVDVLLFSTSPAYPRYVGAHGISALTDQRLAGVVMMTEQLLTLGICVALLLRPYVRQRQQNPAFT